MAARTRCHRFRARRPDTAEQAVLADSVSLAVLVVLESLSPLERAVFVLREAFGFPYAEIAATLERSETAVRQLAGRAKRHVEERKPRYDVDPAVRRDLTERFLAAASGGDLEQLLALLAPDVRLVSDSGGRSKAPRRIIETADKVGRFLFALGQGGVSGMEAAIVELNGGPALVMTVDGKPDTIFQVEVRGGVIQCAYIIRNPDKLASLLRGQDFDSWSIAPRVVVGCPAR